jgi:hypothetical protein
MRNSKAGMYHFAVYGSSETFYTSIKIQHMFCSQIHQDVFTDRLLDHRRLDHPGVTFTVLVLDSDASLSLS